MMVKQRMMLNELKKPVLLLDDLSSPMSASEELDMKKEGSLEKLER